MNTAFCLGNRQLQKGPCVAILFGAFSCFWNNRFQLRLWAEQAAHRTHSTAKENTSLVTKARPLPLSPSSQGVSQTDRSQPVESATYPHAAFPIKQDSCVNPVSPGRWINTFTARNCKTIAVSCCMCVSSRHKTTLKLETDDLFMYV